MEGKLLILALSALAQAFLLPGSSGHGLNIQWENIKPRHPTFTPWARDRLMPQELIRRILGLGNTPVAERYPGYRRGTLDLSAECGQAATMSASGRIVGGTEATPHSYPWMAALFVDDQWFCGGTLISEEWVLTAAHCAKDATEMKVMLGAHNVREATEEGRMELITRDFFTHPSYSTFTLHNDLALVHLPKKVNFTDTIRPVCLPAHSEAEEAWAKEAAVASGWGKPTDEATSISPVLRRVDTDTITNLACAVQYPTVVNKNVICISGKDGMSTCNGDSGGPLYLVSEAGVHKQIGITSFGSSLGCEIGMHAGFTRPASYLEWIETETNVAIAP